MPSDIAFTVALLHRKVGPGAVLSEPLLASRYSRLGNTTDAAADAVRELLAGHFAEVEPVELMRHRHGGDVQRRKFTLVVDPPRDGVAWRKPMELVFHAAVWQHTGGYILARVPALGIEIIAEEKGDLEDLLRKEALAALRRTNATVNLKTLLATQATAAFRIDSVEITAKAPTLKERAIRGTKDVAEKKSTLDTVATRLHAREQDAAYELETPLKRLAEALTAKPTQSVLLVGPSGVGKTALFRELARRRESFGLPLTPFYQTSGSRIVAGQCGFGMWEQRCGELVKDAAKLNAIVGLGQLFELLNVGKSEFNTTGLASFLRSSIARGEFLCVAECTPEQVAAIEKEDPLLLGAFQQVAMEEPDADTGRRILAQAARALARRKLSPEALALIDRLHRRFATYSAFPGRPLQFLKNLLRDGEPARVIDEAEVFEAFVRETGLPRSIIDPAVPLDPEATRNWFSARVIGQPEAVDLIADVLATVKAGLTRPGRPIASLLFIGPTGVGKTEMAKSLAEFLFGSKDRLTRFDMNEFADPISVRRLVGGVTAGEGLLTAKIREQPFSVLLLDEVEKADHSLFDLLLQALGEARLTDAEGRLADFRNAVIVMTSNLGAESFRDGRMGFRNAAPGNVGAAGHFTDAVEKFLRPEMVNRLDRILPFSPLQQDVVRLISAREWRKVLARDGVRFRDLQLTSDEGLADFVAAAGYDIRYGARPLQRAMERKLLVPLARELNRYGNGTPLAARIDIRDGEAVIGVKAVAAGRTANRDPDGSLEKLALRAQTARRWHQMLEQSSFHRELANEITQLKMREREIIKRQLRGKPLSNADNLSMARLGRLQAITKGISDLRAEAETLEDDFLARALDVDGSAALPARARLEAAEKAWDALLMTIYAHQNPQSTSISLALFSEDADRLFDLAHAYRELAVDFGLRTVTAVYCIPRDLAAIPVGKEPPEAVDAKCKTYWHDDKLIAKGPPKVVAMEREWQFGQRPYTIGMGIGITGPAASLRFCGEGMLHVFPQTPGSPQPKVWVQILNSELKDFLPGPALTRQGAIPADLPKRVYSDAKVVDPQFAEPFANLRGSLKDHLMVVIGAGTRRRLLNVVTE